MPPYAGHPHDPRTPEHDGDDATIDVINDVLDWMAIAEVAVTKGDIDKARHRLSEVRMLIEDMIGDAQ